MFLSLPRRCACVLALLALVMPACRPGAGGGCSGTEVRLNTPGRLVVAADYSYPPFAFRSPDNDLIGYEVDLTKALALEMKLEVRFVNRGAGALITGLLAHRHDVAASALRPTATLREEACLSASYLAADLGVLVPADNPRAVTTTDDLAGATVAVVDNDFAEGWALRELGASTISAVRTTDDLFTAVREGRADAAVTDLPVARFAQANSEDFAVAASVETGDGYVLAVGKDNAALLSGIDAAIERLRTNGTLQRLERTWFGG